MLLLGSFKRWMQMPRTDIWLQLSPLHSDADQRAHNDAQVQLPDTPATEGGKPAIKGKTVLDYTLYAQLRGRACIHAWRGVSLTDDNGEPTGPAPCTIEHIDELMRIDVAQRFVLEHIYELNLRKADEVIAAGNVSAPSSPGIAAVALSA